MYCLDAATGKVRWAYTTEGPVRFAPTVRQGKLYAGSDDGHVYCLNAKDGNPVWRYRAGPEDNRHPGNGRMISMWPVRSSVLVDQGQVYFTAGLFPRQGTYLCCLDANDGSELFKQETDQPGQGYLLATPSRLFVPTGRTPCRAYDRSTGKRLAQYGSSNSWQKDLVGGSFALVVDDLLVTGPSEDDHLHFFKAETAERIVRAAAKRIIVKDSQAYLLKNSKLACYDRTELIKKSKQSPTAKWEVDCRTTSCIVMVGNTLITGGSDKVIAYSATNGVTSWASSVTGTAEGLAVCDGQLLVSTDQGVIHCFVPRQDGVAHTAVEADETANASVYPDDKLGAACQVVAKAAVDAVAVTKGYCLVLGIGTGRLAYEIAKISDFRVIGIEEDRQKLDHARESLKKAGLYGSRIVLHQGKLDSLPYTKYFANLIISETALAYGRLPPSPDEVLRVLRPCGGTILLAMTGTDSGLTAWGSESLPGWAVKRTGELLLGTARRGKLPGAGEWSHFYADPSNTACSGDELKFGPMAIQWYGQPGPQRMVDRHRKTVAPVYKNGRLFVTGLDYIAAVDAYNGTVLWDMDLPQSARIRASENSGNMVATDDGLYVAAGPDCIQFDAQTGKRVRTLTVPLKADSKDEWGYMAIVGDILYGSVTKPEAAVRRQIGQSGGFVCSDSLFAVGLRSGERLWDYAPTNGVIINPAIAIGSGRVYCVRSLNPKARDEADGRMGMDMLVGQGTEIAALDSRTGNTVWQHQVDLKALQHAIYLSCSEDTIVLTGSKTLPAENTKKGLMRYDVRAFDAASGKQLWQSDHVGVNDKDPGDHGNSRQHPAIVGNTLYGSNFACDLRTGKMIDGWKWKKSQKCATVSTSANLAFSRFTGAKIPVMFDLSTGTQAALTTVTRPGCWINTIPAGGLILIPEASSGCTCPYPVQTSLALVPRD